MSTQKKPRMAGLGRLRIKTIDLYVVRLFLAAYIACFVIFAGFFIAIEFSFKFDRFMREEGNIFATLLKYNLAMIPTVFTNFMGPILTSAAGLFTVTLLNRNNEIQALKTNGMSTYRLLLPIFFMSFLPQGQNFPDFPLSLVMIFGDHRQWQTWKGMEMLKLSLVQKTNIFLY